MKRSRQREEPRMCVPLLDARMTTTSPATREADSDGGGQTTAVLAGVLPGPCNNVKHLNMPERANTLLVET
jgi:hypothetical protein